MISIVLPTHNRSSSLKNVIETILGQEPIDSISFELLVVDNNSTDDTKDIVKNLAIRNNRIKYHFEKQRGRSCALNKGIIEAQGDILAIIDDDDVPSRYWLSAIYKKFLCDAEIDVVLGWLVKFKEGDQLKDVYRSATYHPPRELLMGNGGNMAMRKNVFLKIGLFDHRIGVGSKFGGSAEDTDFIYRCMRNNIKVEHSKDIVVFYRQRNTNSKQLIQLKRDWYGVGFLWAKYTILIKDYYALKRVYWHTCENLYKSFFARGETRKAALVKLIYLLRGFIFGVIFWPFQKNIYCNGVKIKC
ncbi:MAG: glycosyltransferase [Candidatus Omnitrophota bacterium]